MLGTVLRSLVIIVTLQFGAALLGVGPGVALVGAVFGILIAETSAFIVGRQREKW